jgi:hypothetical protein
VQPALSIFVRTLMKFVILPLSLTGHAAAESWVRQVNERFGTTIEHPRNFKLVTAPDEMISGETESRTLLSADGRAEIRLTGSYGPIAFGGFEKYQAEIVDLLRYDGTSVTYKALGKNWFTLSGRNGDNIEYVKVIAGCAGAVGHELWVRYPAAEKVDYDALVSRLARSLRGRATNCKAEPN